MWFSAATPLTNQNRPERMPSGHAAAQLGHDRAAHHAAVEYDLGAPRGSDIRFRQGVGRQLHRPVRRSAPERPDAVREVQKPVFPISVELVEHGNAAARLASHVENDVGAHCRTEDDEPAVRRVRRHRLPVERDDRRFVVPEFDTEDPRIRCIDEAQTDTLAFSDRKGVREAPVDGDRVAEPAIVAHVVGVVEISPRSRPTGQAPVVEHPCHVTVDADRIDFFDDERAV